MRILQDNTKQEINMLIELDSDFDVSFPAGIQSQVLDLPLMKSSN